MSTAMSLQPKSSQSDLPAAEVVEADVCLIAEGCYPYVSGGVSSWIDWLMRTQSDLEFSVVAIVSGFERRQRRYSFPPNVRGFSEVVLHRPLALHWSASWVRKPPRAELADALIALTSEGGAKELARIIELVKGGGLSFSELLNSRLAWDIVCRMYDTIMPQASFLHFYWAWRALFGGLFATLKAPLPKALVYHTISTGYAGMLAARAALETGRPAIITEHGIYTNERRIEILTADWMVDTVEKGLSINDDRIDLRDVWIRAFDAYARACYDACSAITTLYRDNQRLQMDLGAKGEKLKVIANGIEVERFNGLPRATCDMRPTMALIGRVVPIKDVKTFISAAADLRGRIPHLRALVLGPTDEDPAYFKECTELACELGLQETLIFTGNVNLVDYLPQIHVVVLTSLSEAQPLVLLEAGAAGIPCVTTDVGSCREILEGIGEQPALGPGGMVTHLVAPKQIADAVCGLLQDELLRRRLGHALCERVRRHYGSDRARREYSMLYRQFRTAPPRPPAARSG
jgi:glycosyltransferase involved in cell wall biosynthesis